MKVLQINSHYDQGGAARIVACIHRQLLEDGVKSYVAYGRGAHPAEKNVYRIDKNYEVWFSALLCRAVGLNGWWNRRATRRLIALIRRLRPDVVHIHNLHGYYVNFGLLFDYLNKEDIPLVWTFHDCHAFVGNCGYYFECGKWKEGCRSCPDIHRYPKSQFFDFSHYMWKRKKELFTAPRRMVVVTPSQWLAGAARQSFFGKYECLAIRNGIDTEHIFYPRGREACRRKYGYGQEEKLVLGIAVGYGDERKGAKYMLGLARALGEEAKVILVGWEPGMGRSAGLARPRGGRAAKQAVSAQDARLCGEGSVDTACPRGGRGAKQLLSPNIIAIPRIEDAGVLAEYYSIADVFVLSSLAENYPTVSLEAMACGTPVVGFAVGGTPEQLGENKGIAVQPGNLKALVAAVRRALAPGNGLLRGEALAEKIREENSIRKMVDAYKEVYAEVMGGGKR